MTKLIAQDPIGEVPNPRTLRQRVWWRLATKVKHSSNLKPGKKKKKKPSSSSSPSQDGDETPQPRFLSTQPLSKPAICFDWHSFVREERRRADSWWCKRRARKAFLPAAEEQIISHCNLQERLSNWEEWLIPFIDSDASRQRGDYHFIAGPLWLPFVMLLINSFVITSCFF